MTNPRLKNRGVILLDVALGAGANATLSAVDLYGCDGFFSLQYEITGSGTLTLEVEVSSNGVDWSSPDPNVLTAQSAGKGFTDVEITPAPLMRFKATEAGGAQAVTAKLWLHGI